MKKTWEEPKIMVQQFMPNEYVATCGDENRVYNFVCDAGGGIPGTVYEDSNHNGKWDLFGDEALTGHILPTYHACGETHSAPTDDEFIEGFYYLIQIRAKQRKLLFGQMAEPIFIVQQS